MFISKQHRMFANRRIKVYIIISINEVLDEVDAVIVTALDAYHEIKKILEKKINCPILSLEDLLYEMGNIVKAK